MGDENEDVIVKEIDVYLSKSLANNVYVLQVTKLTQKYVIEILIIKNDSKKNKVSRETYR